MTSLSSLTDTSFDKQSRNPVALYLLSLTSEQSRRVMAQALRTMASVLLGQDAGATSLEDVLQVSWQNLRYEHIQTLRAHLSQSYSASSVNRMLSALRGVLRQAWRLGYMDAETLQRALDVPNVRSHVLPAGRDLASGEIWALVQVCLADAFIQRGIRDVAIIGVLYGCGLRRSEVARLRYQDFEASQRALVVQGKGNKQRRVYISGGAERALKDWLVWRGDDAGALFLPTRKGGVIVRRLQDGALGGITPQTIYDMLKRRAKQAGVADFSPHDFRRTFVGDLLDNGVDLVTIQKLVGHSHISTTARYDRRDERSKQDAVKKLHFPYQ